MPPNYRNLIRAYLTLGFIGTIAGVVGIASGINSLLGGGSSGGGSSGQGSGSTANTGVFDQIEPSQWAAYQKLLGLDPTSYINAGTQAGQQYSDLGKLGQQDISTLGQQANTAYSNAGALTNAGNALWSTVQNPQSGLFGQLHQQVLDDANAQESMRGIGMSPYAANLTSQADSNFLNQWNNNFVQNQAAGLGAMGQAYGQAGQQSQLGNADLTGALNLGGQGAGYTLQGGQLPFITQQQAGAFPFQYGTQYANTLNTAINPNLIASNQNGFTNNQTNLGNFLGGLGAIPSGGGQAGSWLSSLFGGGGGSGGGGTSSGADFSSVQYT